jgi:hypothetical protein
MAFPSRASLRQQAADRGRWLSAITLKATDELYQRCAEHAAHLISAKAPAMQAHALHATIAVGATGNQVAMSASGTKQTYSMR